jgi:hypothetical protein
MRCIKESTNK